MRSWKVKDLLDREQTDLVSARSSKVNNLKEGGNWMQASTTEVQNALGNLNYPVKKRQLLEEARRQMSATKQFRLLRIFLTGSTVILPTSYRNSKAFRRLYRFFTIEYTLQVSRNLSRKLKIFMYAT